MNRSPFLKTVDQKRFSKRHRTSAASTPPQNLHPIVGFAGYAVARKKCKAPAIAAIAVPQPIQPNITAAKHVQKSVLIAAFYPTQIRATGIGFTQPVSRIGSFVGPLLGGFLISLSLAQRQLLQFIAIPSFLAAVLVFLLEGSQRARSPSNDYKVKASSY
jgi:AAHS family 4-hydroxybenzoate transporter-like MFS transporter